MGEGWFNHLGLCVTDLERSRRFYEEALGFREVQRLTPDDGPTARLLRLGPPVGLTAAYLRKGPVILELLHFARGARPAVARTFDEPGLTHFSISVDDVADTCARVEALGGTVLHDTDLGGAAVMVRDPDGQLVEVLAGWRLPEDGPTA